MSRSWRPEAKAERVRFLPENTPEGRPGYLRAQWAISLSAYCWVFISTSSLPLWHSFHSFIPGKFIAPCDQQLLTLLDSGGEAQLASLDLFYGCLQAWGQKLCYFQVQHELLCIAAKRAYCNANRSPGRQYASKGCLAQRHTRGGEEQPTRSSRPSAQPLPPLPAEQADLVGHHALLQLVFGCRWTAHLAGVAFQGSNLHHIVDKGQREAEAAQDVGVLLLLKGTPRGVTRGRLLTLSCASDSSQMKEITSEPETFLHFFSVQGKQTQHRAHTAPVPPLH